MRSQALLIVGGWLIGLLLVSAPASATPEYGTRGQAVAMVNRVEQMFEKNGASATFKAVDDKSNKEFHIRDLYAFIYTLSGVCVAHGAFPALIGKNLIDLKDPDGEYLVRAIIAVVEKRGHGWVDYKWPDPITHKIEDKTSYVEKLGTGYFVGVGLYRQ